MPPASAIIKKTLQSWLWLTVVFFSCMLIACDRNRVYEENLTIENGIWNIRKQAGFDAEITELNHRYNVYLNVRNSPEYSYSNLYLFLTTTLPDGNKSRDTLELTLADYDGRWLGSGMGSVKFSRFMLKNALQFTQKGHYHFEFEHGMRVNDLTGIRDIGLRIEKQ